MQRNTRYAAVLTAILAALAFACAEPTAPRQSAPCSGGGTGTWDLCDTTSTSAIHIDTGVVVATRP